MKKTLFLSLILALLFSCKKEETPEQQFMREQKEELIKLEKNAKMPKTSLAIDNPDFDFGSIKHGETVEHIYEITNTGSQPLIISMVKPTCGCTAPDFTTSPILPKTKGRVTLKFDSKNFPNQTVLKTAMLYCNVEKSPIELRFKAIILK